MAIAVDHTEQALAQLEDGIRKLADEPEFRRWLKAQGVFWRYSWQNSFLIALQRPDATAVAGFQAWRKLDRSVRKGSTAIRILAPCTRRGEVEDAATGEKTSYTRLTGFRTACVFALEDTDGDELPQSPAHKLTGEAPEGLFNTTQDYLKSLGWSLEVKADGLGGPNGLSRGLSKEVLIDGRMSSRQQLKTLWHEVGHVVAGHVDPEQPRLPREQCETEAEAISFVVATALGVDDAGEYSLGYISSWNSGTDEAIKALRESCGRIGVAARQILTALADELAQEDAA